MLVQTTTGRLTNSQMKVQSFFFDCSDPGVNFTDGDYTTDLVIRANSLIYMCGVKYEQDVSAYPAITIAPRVVTSPPLSLNADILPFANKVNGYAIGNQTPGMAVAAAPGTAVWQVINVDTVADGTVYVRISGMTGSGITALSFMVFVAYFEFEF